VYRRCKAHRNVASDILDMRLDVSGCSFLPCDSCNAYLHGRTGKTAPKVGIFKSVYYVTGTHLLPYEQRSQGQIKLCCFLYCGFLV
jgi:hypothetical protein